MIKSQTTTVYSTVTFRVKGRTKKLTYYGLMSDAIHLIREKYPYSCCEEGHTSFVKNEIRGNYKIVDVLSGEVEHQFEQL